VQALLDLQVEFARIVAERTGIPLARALLDYTNLYVRFGLGRAFDAEHPGWREYVDGLAGAADPRAWTRLFHARRPGAVGPPGLVATFGCFSYADLDGERLRLHFHDAETDGASPLAKGRQDARRAELAALFAHVRRTRRGPRRVIGRSWLYNLEAYRRLFPPDYVASRTAAAEPIHLSGTSSWGQLIDAREAIRPDVRDAFLANFARLDPAAPWRIFPHPVLEVSAPMESFYRHFGV